MSSILGNKHNTILNRQKHIHIKIYIQLLMYTYNYFYILTMKKLSDEYGEMSDIPIHIPNTNVITHNPDPIKPHAITVGA